jgi:hypothetical protein
MRFKTSIQAQALCEFEFEIQHWRGFLEGLRR